LITKLTSYNNEDDDDRNNWNGVVYDVHNASDTAMSTELHN